MIAAVLLLAGCAPFAATPQPSPAPMARAEIESRYKLGGGGGSVREEARDRGVTHLTADDVVALKQAGVPDDATADFVRWERTPEAWDPDAAHDTLHDPFRKGPTRLCPICGGWCRAE